MSFRSISYNKHPELKDKHSFLSPSKYHWINYDDEKLLAAYDKKMDAALGTRLHAFAAEAILLGLKQLNNQQTINLYINDCISYRMEVEQPLFVSWEAFGTADALYFGPDLTDPDGPWVLRIFDLKNGVSPTSEHQLEVYAAYFCIEYNIRPTDIKYDLRIYQNDDIAFFETEGETIAYIMDQTKHAISLINRRKEEM